MKLEISISISISDFKNSIIEFKPNSFNSKSKIPISMLNFELLISKIPSSIRIQSANGKFSILHTPNSAPSLGPAEIVESLNAKKFSFFQENLNLF